MYKTTNSQDQKTKPTPNEEEEEDMEEDTALSLCDFPLNSGEKRDSFKTPVDIKRRSSSEPSEFFEFFFNDVVASDEMMSHAEDIFFRGKLVPFNNRHILKSKSADHATATNQDLSTRSTSGSMDRKKFRPRLMKSEPSDIHRSSSKSSVKSEGSKVPKPAARWFQVLMFGPTKLQQEMDLRDMKNRQVRRSPGTLFPGIDAGGNIPARRSDHRRSSWGFDLLRVLSCKSHASVDAVNASIGLVPHF